jgi:hypothetical protein
MLMTGNEPTFWGEVFPAYLGALGGIASAVVATLAFVLGLRTKRSVASVKEVLEPEEQTRVEPARPPERVASQDRHSVPAEPEAEGGDIGETVAYGYLAGRNPPDGEPWTVMREVKTDGVRPDLALANSSARALTLIGIEIFNGTQWIPALLPETSEVKPGEIRYFDFKRLGGRESNINVVQVLWIDASKKICYQRVLL